MSKKRDWQWRSGGEQAYILVDNRFDRGGSYKYDQASNKIWVEETPGHKWTPLLHLQYSERFTWEEFVEYAQVLTDRLNAFEVEKVLKGEE